MGEYITHIKLSQKSTDETKFMTQGFEQLPGKLGSYESGDVCIWFKRDEKAEPITRIQVAFSGETTTGLSNAGFSKIEGKPMPDVKNVILWCIKGKTEYDVPIAELAITTKVADETGKLKLGWDRAGCNLSGVCGERVYLWLRRKEQVYIRDVNVTNSCGTDEEWFKKGYIRIDQSANTISAVVQVLGIPIHVGISSTNFFWFRLTTDRKSALTHLKIATSSDEGVGFKNEGFESVPANVCEGMEGKRVNLWHKKVDGEDPVQSMMLIVDPSARDAYDLAGADVSQDINSGNAGDERYLCVLQKN